MPEGGGDDGADFVACGQRLAACVFNLAALHPAYPIKRRTSVQRTQATRRHPEEPLALGDRNGVGHGVDVDVGFGARRRQCCGSRMGEARLSDALGT